MDNRFNTIAGWVLGGGIVLLGASLVHGRVFQGRASRDDGLSDRRRGRGRRRRRRRSRAADRGAACRPPMRPPARPAFASAPPATPSTRAAPNGTRPESLRHDRGAKIAARRRLRLFRCAAQPWRPVDLGDDERSGCKSPRTFAPGTKMTFAGLSNPAGARQSDRLSECAGQQPADAAAARRRGAGRGRCRQCRSAGRGGNAAPGRCRGVNASAEAGEAPPANAH